MEGLYGPMFSYICKVPGDLREQRPLYVIEYCTYRCVDFVIVTYEDKAATLVKQIRVPGPVYNLKTDCGACGLCPFDIVVTSARGSGAGCGIATAAATG